MPDNDKVTVTLRGSNGKAILTGQVSRAIFDRTREDFAALARSSKDFRFKDNTLAGGARIHSPDPKTG